MKFSPFFGTFATNNNDNADAPKKKERKKKTTDKKENANIAKNKQQNLRHLNVIFSYEIIEERT